MKNAFILLGLFFLTGLRNSAQNYVTTYSGNGSSGFINGFVDTAKYSLPFGLCIDKNDNLFIADGENNCIRKINTNLGLVSTFAGSGIAGWADGSAFTARFNSPSDLCVDDSGNVYVADFQNHRIRKITVAGNVITIAGSGIAGYIDGTSSAARFNYPRGICRDASGNLYIGDSWNHRIRKIDTAGNVSTYAGGGTNTGVSSVGDYIDAADTSARFYTPSGLTIDQHGNIFVADAYNHRIRKIDVNAMVSTITGNGLTGPGNGGYLNGNSSLALLNTPTEIFLDTLNNEMYISDTFNQRVRKVEFSAGNVSTFAGSGNPAFQDGIDSLASFNYPRGIALSNNHGKKVYVCDYNNHSIRLITVSVTNISEDENVDGINIFPNPAVSFLNVEIKSQNELKQILISDAKGIQLNTIDKFKATLQIDISVYPAGIYFLNFIFDNGRSINKKITIK